MSSKQSSSKQDSRIAKKEVIVTRHKSAQMKRQLRVRDRSMKHLTDLLKSPTRETQTSQPTNVPKNIQKPKTPPKHKNSLLKSVEKVQNLPEKVFKLSKVLRKKVALVEDVEFYPNKRKRTLDVKKVVLKSNNELQMVASIVGSVKRKCRVPNKATSKPESREPSPVYSQLSMAEVISMMDDDLTDEDLMEILTCPSPVWWEDGPGEEYIEEAVFRRTPEPPPESKKEEAVIKMVVEEENKAETIKIPDLSKKSEKFLKKRSKLEGLLGNIKNKNNKVESVNNDSMEDKVVSCSNSVFNEDLVVICSNYRKSKTSNNKTENNEDESRKRTKSESDSDEVIFHDSSMNEDELLRSLENMEIPIDNSQTDVIVIDDDDDDILEITTFDIKKEKSNKDNGNDKINKVKDDLKTLNHTLNVPKNMPVLMQFENREVASPKSFDSTSSKISAASQDIDSISDTNIKFILDEEMDENKINNNISANEKAVLIKKENIKQESSKETNLSTKNMTTYRIVEETTDQKSQIVKNIDVSKENSNQDEKDEKSAKINDYYKKCKKVYQRKDKTDVNKNEVSKVKDENTTVPTKFMFYPPRLHFYYVFSQNSQNPFFHMDPRLHFWSPMDPKGSVWTTLEIPDMSVM
ncbi:hypothetical protein MSG28_015945 [Choristoneura fumiferana]|uniref:Uncharacterized protein n=1 Tax=Choristoneura fumiferana TaxID=7141 RepID=A0ACC0K5A0_CHOFU|nr:hypothetical protein MSG28_015945 [Choristoneura fumiferana]